MKAIGPRIELASSLDRKARLFMRTLRVFHTDKFIEL